jgi:hypothetical protein
MARAIGKAEENAIKTKLIVDKWVGDVISTAGNIVTGLTITRALSFAIVTSYLGGAGFASLARSGAGLVRAGLTVTAVGAGSNALARGGGNLAGQAGLFEYGSIPDRLFSAKTLSRSKRQAL